MNTLFPFGFPAATQLYLALYVVTLAAHAVLMSYVLAGTGYVAIATGLGQRRSDSAARALIDWLPFGLGVAITAGVAPLLFLQILYKESFYTANLLLFHRWMAIVPVLIVGFYLLYLMKSKTASTWSRPARAAVACGAFGCFGFTAWSWTGNHLLALSPESWVGLYTSGGSPAPSTEMLLRLGLWVCGAVPVMAVIAAWQVRGQDHAGTSATETGDRGKDAALSRLTGAAIGGLLACMGLGYGYFRVLQADLSEDEAGLFFGPLFGSLAGPYFWMLGAGLAAQLAGWVRIRVGRYWSRGALFLVTAGMVLSVLATAVVRESLRLARIDISALTAVHEQTAENGGMGGFLLSLVVMGGIIGWCLVATRKALRATKPPAQ